MQKIKIISSTVATGLIAAASAFGGADAASAIQSDPKAPLTVWVDGNRSTQAKAYKAAHPEIAITINTVDPSQGSNTSKIALAVKAGSGIPDVVFLGSCTNSRLSDLRDAANVLRGRRIAEGVRMLVVPGSEAVRRDAEREGLHQVFTAAGAEWRVPGCSMCIAMNGDLAQPGQLVVSTSNRNFEGRQGKGARTVLASPATAAASALAGRIADPREYATQVAA